MRIILFLLLTGNLYAGTCTSISRTNNAANAVLTSTKYNTDLNTVYAAANDLDGGCVDDASLEFAALNTTSFESVVNGIKEGCLVSYSDANTVSVGSCILVFGGRQVKTTSATTVTWGCTDCSAQAASTLYYVYARSTSSGATLNLLISTTAPGLDGFNSSDKVLGAFYNNAAQDIPSDAVRTWKENGFSRFMDNSIAILVDQKTLGTSGGTCTTGAQRTRDLNTFHKSAWFVTVSANQFTLLPGKYRVDWHSPVSTVNATSSSLYDITGATIITVGEAAVSGAGDGTTANSKGTAYVEISSANVYEIRMACQTTSATTGMGSPSGASGGTSHEVYARVIITRLGD